ncbi:MAG TPA: YbbR-like domain-containing protein [Gemmatimonadales bacterium]|nr:YbbR-like domain-containing protein [Gemmatimonadales bacterium]
MSTDLLARLTRNWPIKLAALLLSATLYVAVAAQEQITQAFPVTLAVVVPPGRTLLQAPPQVSVVVRGRGREILKLRVFPTALAVRVPDTLTAPVWHVILRPGDVDLPKGADVEVSDLTPRELDIRLDSVVGKNVPVVPRVTVLPESGQALEGGLQLTPAVVRVVGSEQALARIESVTTVPTELSGVHGAFQRSLPIDTEPLGLARIAPRSVQVSGTTTTIFERTFEAIRVESGAGALAGFTLLPAHVAVTVRGGEAQVQGLSRDSIKVIALITNPSAAFAQLRVLAPRGLTIRVSPDSVEVRRKEKGRG